MRLAYGSLLLLLACKNTEDSTKDSQETIADMDGDGFLADQDCDDYNTDVHPGATERCDGVDNDCDAQIDDAPADGATWYADQDGDGYGSATSTSVSCSQPDGYIADATDCDDSSAAIHPGAPETDCTDATDYDCDGQPAQEQDWYLDQDGDGYGDAGQSTRACAQPDGYVADATDCNDADSAFYPNAAEDDCTDPNDYNCDGVVTYDDSDGDGVAACVDCDDADPSVAPGLSERCDGKDNDCNSVIDDAAVDAAVWYADADTDGWGDSATTQMSCAAIAGYVAVGGDCNDADSTISPGVTEVCDGIDNDCDSGVDVDASDAGAWYADGDGDGFGDGATPTYACTAPAGFVGDDDDCDDANAAINPDATEVCDGVDNDCDALIDDASAADAATWYADADADGYGDLGASARACAQPDGYVATATDCDDGAATAWPGAPELCDGISNDCDDDIDEDSVDAPTWYVDNDGDGAGDPGTSLTVCYPPAGYISAGDDCDDADPAISPTAVDICDGVDNDCSGVVDDADDAGTWYADVDGDGFGDPATLIKQCEAPPGYGLDGSDCDDTNAAISPVAIEACNGQDDDCDATIDEAEAIDAGTWYADADADGYGDSADSVTACDPGDGWAAMGGDCATTDSGIFPGAAETCDGVDQDCDGTVDDAPLDAATWYIDADGDGYGSDAAMVTACVAPDGYVAEPGDPANLDCDDTLAAISPAADERCNSLDDDCDGDIDEDDAIDAHAWYADTDADGVGSDAWIEVDCDQPLGFVSYLSDGVWSPSPAGAADCDDADDSAAPLLHEQCDDVDNDCDGEIDEDAIDAPTWYRDNDADGVGTSADTATQCDAPAGYVADDGDCADTNAAISPAATEVCDGDDNNCDGVTDGSDALDALVWARDVDGDGYGDLFDLLVQCDVPAGYVFSDTADCNDADATIFPSATERCDGADNDCDSLTDEEDAVDVITWFFDNDNDGFGTTDGVLLACDPPSGYVATADDCDDADPNASPIATEVCNLADDDCDGERDEPDAADAATWYADEDGDGCGVWEQTATACDAPTGYVGYHVEDGWAPSPEGAADCDDTRSDIYPGYTEICEDGVDNDCDGTATGCRFGTDRSVADADASFSGAAAGDALGRSAAGVGDINGDGFDDFVIGADLVDVGTSTSNGRAWFFTGPVDESVVLADATATITGSSRGGYLGSAVSGGGDWNGDGVHDVAIGAYGVNSTSGLTGVGQALVFSGVGLSGSLSASSAVATISGSAAVDYTGRNLAWAGDVDDDGFDDLLVAASNRDTGSVSNTGAVGLFCGPLSGSIDFATGATTILQGSARDDQLGLAMSGGDDLDGDGVPEVIVASLYAETGSYLNNGVVYVFTGPTTPGTLAASTADLILSGGANSVYFGTAIDAGGDHDDDGYADLAVGAPSVDVSIYADAGVAYVFNGSSTLPTSLSPSGADASLSGASAYDYVGAGVQWAGDVDNDGLDDLLVGADGWNGAYADSGAVVLWYGGLSGATTISSAAARFDGYAAYDELGNTLAAAGDTDGDGYDDFLLGAVSHDPSGQSGAGGVWLFTGSGL